jgi:hypothetical protein
MKLGKKYSDGVNNIQHIGHFHPRIANAEFLMDRFHSIISKL